jgi:hypothetical protein
MSAWSCGTGKLREGILISGIVVVEQSYWGSILNPNAASEDWEFML